MATQPLPNRERSHSIVWPTILIGFGLLFLAQNAGLVPGSIWWGLWQLWPLLLVAIGVDLMFRRSLVGSLVGVGLVLALGAALVLGLRFTTEAPYYTFGALNQVEAVGEMEQLNVELGPTRRATVTLNHGFGRLNVAALPADSNLLIDATLPSVGDGSTSVRRIDRTGDRAVIELRDRERIFRMQEPVVNNWDVRLSPQVATSLRIDTGASTSDVDLRDLNVSNVTINSGAGTTRVVAPRAGRSNITIHAGAAAVAVSVPEGTAARLTIKNGLGTINVDTSRFQQTGKSTYESPNYASATNRADITIESGVSTVTVR